METSLKYGTIQPRFLRYRNHSKIYVFALLLVSALLGSYWCFQISHTSLNQVWSGQKAEVWWTASFFVSFFLVYFFWLRLQLKKSVQVFLTHLHIHNHKTVQLLKFEDVESVGTVCWSLFYLKMKDGTKFYFNSHLDRVDYVWEGIHHARPELINDADYEAFRLKLVQYDHHQKRKDWFFRHKLVDIFNWFGLPAVLILSAYTIQSKDVFISQPGMYFFRLFMFTLLILLVTAFFFSVIVKKYVFDRKIARQLVSQSGDKLRNLEFEGVILHRSKIFQVVTGAFMFAVMIQSDINFISVTQLKEHVSEFGLKKGNTVTVDNRFNCLNCRYQVKDGDLIVFSRGYFGQVMAKEGDFVGEISQDKSGRTIASDNVQAVPQGHVAVRAANGKDIVFVKISEIIGKIRN